VQRTQIDLQNRDVTLTADWAVEIDLQGVRFYRERRQPDRTRAFENLRLPSEVPDGIFVDPSVEMNDRVR
jgi:hypothetical protein